ncbi:AAA family ATPase [Roseomonas sp. PWR1]|uniref:AAA family ATPase n=1 Tax=Roseomonas nitratireducens TaxID=2820810 RepID=A0ABS4ATL6_9PROT|nr:DUF3696 domain-containing protein [Neoroseomonas nitratireducens]MBP0464594.1 AAA family ATPase [Neoroseomonas nitratireducens]
MLKSIRLENFKAFGDPQEVPISPITLIYGPNSAGKSSIIQSLLLMRQSMQSASVRTPLFNGDDTNLGTYLSALFEHNTENKMKIGFSFQTRSSYSPLRLLARSTTRSIDIEFDLLKSGYKSDQGIPAVFGIKYGFHDTSSIEFELSRIVQKKTSPADLDDSASTAEFQVKDLLSARNLAKFFILHNMRSLKPEPISKVSQIHDIEIDEAFAKMIKKLRFYTWGILPFRAESTVLSQIKMSDEIKFSLSSPYSPLELARRDFADELLGISYLGPLRSPPARHYIISGTDKQSVGSRGERMPQIMYRRKRDVIPRINEKLKEFGIPYSIDIQMAGNSLTGEIVAIALSDSRGVVVSPSDVGFGIGQLLPILVEGVVATGQTICVEQPEIHLHPRLQGHLADFLYETAKTHTAAPKPGLAAANRRYGGNQWIVETHSEALMLRFQTLIKNKEIPSSFVSVLYVEPTDGRGSRVLKLRLDDDGDFIDEWPHGFFEESFQEIFSRRA